MKGKEERERLKGIILDNQQLGNQRLKRLLKQLRLYKKFRGRNWLGHNNNLLTFLKQ